METGRHYREETEHYYKENEEREGQFFSSSSFGGYIYMNILATLCIHYECIRISNIFTQACLEFN